MKRKVLFTDIEREEIRKFAERITPPSWNVFLDFKKRRKDPGILNISLDIRDAHDEKDSIFQAAVRGWMSFCDRIGYVHVVIQPYVTDWQGLIIHEFAHLAVYRWVAYKTKVYRKPIAWVGHRVCYYCLPREGGAYYAPKMDEETREALSSGHGPVFQKARKAFEKRAEIDRAGEKRDVHLK